MLLPLLKPIPGADGSHLVDEGRLRGSFRVGTFLCCAHATADKSFRLSSYQLRLHLPRTGPIPSDELLAREMLDRERTYLLLVCFDHCYRLHGDSDRSGQTGMTSISDVDAYRWIEDWRGLLAEDDTQFCFSIE